MRYFVLSILFLMLLINNVSANIDTSSLNTVVYTARSGSSVNNSVNFVCEPPIQYALKKGCELYNLEGIGVYRCGFDKIITDCNGNINSIINYGYANDFFLALAFILGAFVIIIPIFIKSDRK